MKMLDKMERLGLIERYSKTLFLHRITQRWFDIVTVAKAERKGEQSSSLPAQQKENKVPPKEEQSSSLGENKVPPHKEYSKEVVRGGEETPTPAPEFQNLQSQKKESPKVAEKGSFQSCSIPCSPSDFHKNGKCAENGCFEVTAIATGSEIPGVTLVGAAPFADENGKTWHDGTQLVQAAPIHHRRNGRIEIPDEAAAEILPWANGDGAQTIKGWYDRAYRQHSPKDVEAMVLKFSGVFLSSEKAAVRDMMETNPLAFFKKRFSGFIVDQPAFDRMNAPRNIGQAANGQSGKANINRLGSDPSVYNQPQKF